MEIPVIYTDNSGSVSSELLLICKNEWLYSLTIDGVEFLGQRLDDFDLMDESDYSEEQLKRFTLNRVPFHDSDKFSADLCNCSLNFEFPLTIIEVATQKELTTTLTVLLKLGKPASNGGIEEETATFQIKIGLKTYKSEGDLFEDALDILKEKMGENYKFKNCYGCLYSDYSPYGNGFFGSMLCFKEQKSNYLKVSKNFSKKDFFDLMEKGTNNVPETYCCNDFYIRKRGTGYRG